MPPSLPLAEKSWTNLVIDQEKSKGTLRFEFITPISSSCASRSLEGGLIVHKDVDTPGKDTRVKSSMEYSLSNTGKTCTLQFTAVIMNMYYNIQWKPSN